MGKKKLALALLLTIALLFFQNCGNGSDSSSTSQSTLDASACVSEPVESLNLDITAPLGTFRQFQTSANLKTASMNGDGSPLFDNGRSYIFDKTFNAGVFYFLSNQSDGNFIYKFNQNTNVLTKVSSISLSLEFSQKAHVVHNGVLYFPAYTSNSGVELWKLNLVSGILSMVADMNPGLEGSGVSDLVIHNNKLYFFSVTDGAAFVLKSFDFANSLISSHPGAYSDSSLGHLTVYNNALYFFDYLAAKLFRYNPTTNAVSVALTVPGRFPQLTTPMTVYNDSLYFGLRDSSVGDELFKYSSTSKLVTKVAGEVVGSKISNPKDLFVFNQKLYFSATDGQGGPVGNELWVYDSIRNKAQVVQDIYLGQNTGGAGTAHSSSPKGFARYNNKMYFAVVTAHGPKVMQMTSDQTISELASFQYPTQNLLHVFGDKLYYVEDVSFRMRSYDFLSSSLNQTPFVSSAIEASLRPIAEALIGNELFMSLEVFGKGVELVKYDIMNNKLTLIADIFKGPYSSRPDSFNVDGLALYFSAVDESNRTRIYKYDTTTDSLVCLCDIDGTAGNSFPLVSFDNQLFLEKFDLTRNIPSLIALDVASAQFRYLKFNDSTLEYPSRFRSVQDKLYFEATVKDVDSYFYYDSTNSQIFLAEENKFPYLQGRLINADDYVFLNNKYYFTHGDDTSGEEFWSYDIQSQSDSMVLDYYPGETSLSPKKMSAIGNKIYFSGNFAGAGREPGVFDPATNSISMLANMVSGGSGSKPSRFTLAHNKIFFTATTDVGEELYVHDPVGNSTRLVHDIDQGFASSEPKLLTSDGTSLYFVANGYLFRIQD